MMTINEIYDKLMQFPKEELALRFAYMLHSTDKERENMRNQIRKDYGFAYEYPSSENEAMPRL